jgi:hypothetical protein
MSREIWVILLAPSAYLVLVILPTALGWLISEAINKLNNTNPRVGTLDHSH